MPKRYGNLKQQILSEDNIILSAYNAQKDKRKQKGVISFNANKELNIKRIKLMLKNSTYKTSKYTVFTLLKPKERIIYRLPFYPDRIVHHALMNVLCPIFTKWFIKNTYSCIKDRGIVKCAKDIESALRNDKDRHIKYCLKLDVRKFYASIDLETLINILKTKIKDKWCLNILYEIIKSVDKGVPIGNYLSQFFGNIYLNKIDHWCKEILKLKYYYRYCDDIVILGMNKKYLYKIYRMFNQRITFLRLKLKRPKIFLIDNGVDFVGYVFYHDYTLLRKSIKINFKKKLKRKYKDIDDYKLNVAPFYGWLIHCDGIHLLKLSIKELYYEFKKHSFKYNGFRIYRVGGRKKTSIR